MNYTIKLYRNGEEAVMGLFDAPDNDFARIIAAGLVADTGLSNLFPEAEDYLAEDYDDFEDLEDSEILTSEDYSATKVESLDKLKEENPGLFRDICEDAIYEFMRNSKRYFHMEIGDRCELIDENKEIVEEITVRR